MLKSPPHDRDHAFAATLAEERREGDRGFPLKRDVAVFVDELLGILFGQLSEGATGTADELTGVVRLVTPQVVHLSELTGKEFYDAVIDTKSVRAVIVRAKN